jgi:hypothetical protein
MFTIFKKIICVVSLIASNCFQNPSKIRIFGELIIKNNIEKFK